MSGSATPLVVGIGGTTVPGSSTERALKIALRGAEAAGMRTRLFDGEYLARLPLYTPNLGERTAEELKFVTAVREASGLILASPGYHGSVSGLVKNALDLMEETAKDPRPYLNDLPVGVVVTAYGWQAIGSTVAALRSIIHALRAWPTPYAGGVNSTLCRFDALGGCTDAGVEQSLIRIGEQVANAIRRNAAA
jgi:FMN reductase